MLTIKTRIMGGILFITAMLIWAVIAVAAVAQTADGSKPSWFEHVDLMSLVIWGLILIVTWFFIRTLKKIDTNQGLLFAKMDALCKEFYTLRGEHDAIKARCDR